MSDQMPSLFVSHGAPDIVVRDMAARAFLGKVAADLPVPKAILVISAHFEHDGVAVVTDPAPLTGYDFGDFDARLKQIKYPAPGAPQVAERAAALIEAAGIPVERMARRDFDHGVWTPLKLLFPDADIPVAQMSVSPQHDSAFHMRLGQALEPLRGEGVLIIGSGALTHNLSAFFKGGFAADAPAPDWVTAFVAWIAERAEAGDSRALLRYRELAPHGVDNHPTPEHILPLFVALGAGGAGARGKRLHHSIDHGVIAMDAYAFG